MEGIILNIQATIYSLEEAIDEALYNNEAYTFNYWKNVRKVKFLKKVLKKIKKLNKN